MAENNAISEWKKREVGVLWKKTGAKGDYLTGSINLVENGKLVKQDVIVFVNKDKKSENSPDWSIYKSEPRNGAPSAPQQKGAAPGQKPAAKPTSKPVAKPAPVESDDDQGNDTPF
jgi:uncharacterized protein (DUF736 family)